MTPDWDDLDNQIRNAMYPPKLKFTEKTGSVYRGTTNYFDFDVDGVEYELVDSRVYKTNSWAQFERKEVRIIYDT